jgi:hypothetical protein
MREVLSVIFSIMRTSKFDPGHRGLPKDPLTQALWEAPVNGAG